MAGRLQKASVALGHGAEVSGVSAGTPHSRSWSQAGEREGQGQGVHLGMRFGVGSPSSAVFQGRPRKSENTEAGLLGLYEVNLSG